MENEVEYIPYSFINNNKKNMNLNWKGVLGAAVSAVISGVLTYIVSFTPLTLFSGFDWRIAIAIAIIVFATSLLKQLGTTQQGNFAGVLPVK